MNRTLAGMLCGCVLSLASVDITQAAEGAADVIARVGLQEAPTPVRERPGWRKPKKIIIGGMGFGLVDELRSVAPGVEILTVGDANSMAKLADADVMIGFCTPQILAASRSIRWIQALTAGVEQCVSVPAVRERNVLVTNMQRVAGPVIAEHAMAMMLGLARGLDLFIPAQAKGQWRHDSLPGGSMSVIDGKTVLVVGLGGIGTEIAKRAHAMGMKVTATRASGRTGPDYVSYIGSPDELPKLAAEADFVVNAAPLTPETKGIFNAALFGKMRRTAYFINIARGGSVVTDDLVAALQGGKIAGAGLDVTDPEPLPPQHPLWSAPHVIITPHVAGESDLGREAELAVVKENVRRYVAGEKMLSVVDTAKGY